MVMQNNGGYLEAVRKGLGQNRQTVTAMDELRASTFLAAVLSGANNYTSGQTLWTVIASSIVRFRPSNVHVNNRESSWISVVFRDGGIAGGVVAGPFRVNAAQDRTIPETELRGRYFLSSLYAVVISGTYAAGADIDVGYLLEPLPTLPGGYLE